MCQCRVALCIESCGASWWWTDSLHPELQKILTLTCLGASFSNSSLTPGSCLAAPKYLHTAATCNNSTTQGV
jgi:hypothetical protein